MPFISPKLDETAQFWKRAERLLMKHRNLEEHHAKSYFWETFDQDCTIKSETLEHRFFNHQLDHFIKHTSICQCRLSKNPAFISQTRRPDARSSHLLECILREEECARNPYLTWSRECLRDALTQRKLCLPELSSHFTYRLALEKDDKNPRNPFRFLDLPNEIRNIIYEKALHTDTEEHLSAARLSSYIPSLLLVCRQVRSEATKIFLRVNLFEFELQHYKPGKNDSVVPEFRWSDSLWLEQLGPSNVANLRRVSFYYTEGSYVENLDIDLCSPNSAEWATSDNCDHDRAYCAARERMTLLNALKETEREAPRMFTEASRIKWRYEQKLKAKKLEEKLKLAEESWGHFFALCGKGNSMRPTIEGLKVLAKAATKIIPID